MPAPVLFTERPSGNGKRLAIATLNAEKSLNALSLDMIALLLPTLKRWAQDDAIACVFLQGAGDKAFCAGGDVVEVYHSILAGNSCAQAFFTQEYRLDYLIHTYPKPLVVWGNGIVMGGGLGLLNGASHRVVTETTRIAMPEINIGLYPDVGGTWFLNHAPGRTGLFLGLTGVTINAADALFVGLADRFIAHSEKDRLIDALAGLTWGAQNPQQQVHALLSSFAQSSSPLLPDSKIRQHYDLIQGLTDGTLTHCLTAIGRYSGDDPWLQSAAKNVATGCPTTFYLVAEQLKRGRHLSLREVFQMELILSVNCAQRGNFLEGVRALLVDKDRRPQFEPATLAGVTPAWIEQHFVPPWGAAPHPLADL